MQIPLSLPDETASSAYYRGEGTASDLVDPPHGGGLRRGSIGSVPGNDVSPRGEAPLTARRGSLSLARGVADLMPGDALTEELRARQRAELARVATAAKIVAPHISGPGGWEAGYDWAIEQLRVNHPSAASEVELAKALVFLKVGDWRVEVRHRSPHSGGRGGMWFLVGVSGASRGQDGAPALVTAFTHRRLRSRLLLLHSAVALVRPGGGVLAGV